LARPSYIFWPDHLALFWPGQQPINACNKNGDPNNKNGRFKDPLAAREGLSKNEAWRFENANAKTHASCFIFTKIFARGK
jgi:hypothetical protein